MNSEKTPFGIIAAAGELPFMVARGARQAGRRVVVVGIRGLVDPAIRELADEFYWAGIAKLGRMIRVLGRSGVTDAIMVGYVRKKVMFAPLGILGLIPDWRFIRLWFFGISDRRTDTVLTAVANEMAAEGIHLEDSTKYCSEALASEGTLSGGKTSAAISRDIEFGWQIAKQMGALDIGQSIAVKDSEVIAVEAIEGTDQMIERAGELCRQGGWTLIKTAKPNQDMRFDVPTIGPNTITNMHQNGGSTLVIEAGKTFIVERDKVLDLARKHRIAIVGRADD